MSADKDSLERSLLRMEASLGRVGRAARPSAPLPPKRPSKALPTAGLTAACLAMVTVGVATGQLALVWGALALLVFGGALLFTELGRNLLAHLPGAGVADPTRPNVGLGAEIADDAIVEPGASVEMGVDVESGAIVRRGAVVRMGCTISKNAIIEAGAVVSWGCDVMEGAVVGANATIGAGATVHANTRVPPGTRVFPGQDFTQGMSGQTVSTPPASRSPRRARVDAACDRLLADLSKTPENLRGFLGDPDRTVSGLRHTCHELLDREQTIRAEAAPDALARLEEERAVLTQRRDKATDEAVKRSLEGALLAIDDQKRQRAHLSAIADRLDAEATRLVLTVEAMSSQVVRLAAASSTPGVTTSSLATSVGQLQSEIEAVAEALEGLTAEDAGMQPIAPITAGDPRSQGERVAEGRERGRPNTTS